VRTSPRAKRARCQQRVGRSAAASFPTTTTAAELLRSPSLSTASFVMRIEELILEGFKSYPVRTSIKGWDSSFNVCPRHLSLPPFILCPRLLELWTTVLTCLSRIQAITGLNGSGQSLAIRREFDCCSTSLTSAALSNCVALLVQERVTSSMPSASSSESPT
jgi:hypothetical protein